MTKVGLATRDALRGVVSSDAACVQVVVSDARRMAPFETHLFEGPRVGPLGGRDSSTRRRAHVAVFVSGEAALPRWYQAVFDFGGLVGGKRIPGVTVIEFLACRNPRVALERAPCCRGGNRSKTSLL